MGKIFYLMGKSSSGKDTIYNKLLQNKKLNLQKIVLYTTRPIRAGEENGIHYYYVDEKKKYPHPFLRIFAQKDVDKWIIRFQAGFRRFLQHLRLP